MKKSFKLVRKNKINKDDLRFDSFYAALSDHDKARLKIRNMLLGRFYKARNMQYEDIKDVRGKRKMQGLPFYDILQNPIYRMKFEYSEPYGLDHDGNFVFEEDLEDHPDLRETFMLIDSDPNKPFVA